MNNKYENDVEFREKTKQRNKEANKLKRQNKEQKKKVGLVNMMKN